MKTKTGMSIGLALTLMVGVFATMLALGLFTNNEARADMPGITFVGASGTTGTGASGDAVMVPENTKAVGKFSFEHDSSAAGHLAVLEESLEWGDLTGTDAALFTFDKSNGGLSFIAAPDFEGNTATGGRGNNDYDVIVTANVEDDDATPHETETMDVNITATDVGEVTVVKVVHAPTGVSSPAKVTVSFNTETTLLQSVGTIIIEFEDDVTVPAVFDEDDITIVSGTLSANPLDVTVERFGTPADESRVTLTVPDMNERDDTAEAERDIMPGLVTVIFRQSAGIVNPTAAGDWDVWVSTSEDIQGTTDSNNDFDTIRSLSLNKLKGKRGSTATATGSGFKDGTTATVWLEQEGDANVQESGEPTLCTAEVMKDDTFSCTFVISASFSRTDTNLVHARDGYDDVANEPSGWDVDAQIKAVPSSAAIGDAVTVQFRDFGKEGAHTDGGTAPDNAVITLGGEPVAYEDFVISGGSANVTITVPDSASLGKQSLYVVGGGEKPRTTMTVLGAQVEITPSTAVPNQSVTITGRGFSGPDADTGDLAIVKEILIGGQAVPRKNIEGNKDVEIDAGGNWVATVIIPITAPSNEPGTYELQAVDSNSRPGATKITIAPRTIGFDPPESRVGTMLVVSGTGWPAFNSGSGSASTDISVDYILPAGSGGSRSVRTVADSNGNFSTTIQVPLDAGIPSTNKITVSSQGGISATQAHRVPGAQITITPSSGPGGTVVTLTGTGFKGFTTLSEVKVGVSIVQPRPNGATVGRDGVLAPVEILIPGFDPGTQTVRATVSGSVVSTSFTITADDAPLPTTGDQTPADAFKDLIDSGNLLTVYSFDEANQVYLSYDPDPANAGFNDLDMVSGGEAYWVRLTADTTFLGKTRYAEWSLVVLP